MKNKFAFFDVDNTIYHGYSTVDLIMYLLNNKLCDSKISEVDQQAVEAYKKRKINYHQLSKIALDNASLALQGHNEADVAGYIDIIIDSKKTIFMDWVQPVFKYLLAKDFEIVLVSAGPDVFIKKLAEILSVKTWFATVMEQNAGIFTGTPVHLLNEKEKRNVITNLLSEDTSSVGFGDSVGDVAMLELVDKAFVVYNKFHREILDIAEQKKWVVFKSKAKVLEMLNKVGV